MQFYKFHLPNYWWSLLTALVLFFPGVVLLAAATGNPGWVTLAILPGIIGCLALGQLAGNGLVAFSVVFFLVAGILEEQVGQRSSMWFHIPPLLLTWILAMLYYHRANQEEIVHQQELSNLEERLTLVRYQYDTDLVVNLSNQKKFQKYSKLNHVSRVLGAQLQLEKVTEKALQEVRDTLGVERGSYSLVLDFQEGKPKIIQNYPETVQPNDLCCDQYGIWSQQHRSSLLVTDVNNDFRFQALGVNTQIRSLMQAPMIADSKVFGLLRAESPKMDAFSRDDLRLLTIIADLVGVAGENARLYQYAQELAITDGLTGLYLRRFFNQRFEEEIIRYTEHSAPFSLMIIDLDHFKRINDQLGHLAGDQILAQFGAKLKAQVRVADLVCRFGGEEFALLLPSTNVEGALVMAERIRVSVAQHDFEVDGEQMHLTISIGLGECPKHSQEMNALIRLTDEALYTAKRKGRNRIGIAGSPG